MERKTSPNFTKGTRSKICSTCKVEKLTSTDFYFSSRDGYLAVCIPCTKKKDKESRQAKPEQAKERKRKWRSVKDNKDKENARYKDYYEINKEHLKNKAKEYTVKNKEKVLSRAKKYRETPDYLDYYYKRNYSLSLEEVLQIKEKQNSQCLICLKSDKEIGKRLYIDHNHETGEVRGLLCNYCNTLIGYAHEEVEILKSAINYLKKYND